MDDKTEKSDDRRQSWRFTIDTVVRIEHDGGTFEARGADIGEKSMLVITEQQLPVDTEVTFTCKDETGKEVSAKARVTRLHEPGGDEPKGFVLTAET